MALDSALVMELKGALVEFKHELQRLRETATMQLELLERIADEQGELHEAMQHVVSELAAAGDVDDDQDEDEARADDEEGDDDSDGKLPGWIPDDVKAAIEKHRKNPAFWLEMLGRIRQFGSKPSAER